MLTRPPNPITVSPILKLTVHELQNIYVGFDVLQALKFPRGNGKARND